MNNYWEFSGISYLTLNQAWFLTAWKVSVFEVILVLIFPYSDWIRSSITPNTDTFYAVSFKAIRNNHDCKSSLRTCTSQINLLTGKSNQLHVNVFYHISLNSQISTIRNRSRSKALADFNIIFMFVWNKLLKSQIYLDVIFENIHGFWNLWSGWRTKSDKIVFEWVEFISSNDKSFRIHAFFINNTFISHARLKL